MLCTNFYVCLILLKVQTPLSKSLQPPKRFRLRVWILHHLTPNLRLRVRFKTRDSSPGDPWGCPTRRHSTLFWRCQVKLLSHSSTIPWTPTPKPSLGLPKVVTKREKTPETLESWASLCVNSTRTTVSGTVVEPRTNTPSDLMVRLIRSSSPSSPLRTSGSLSLLSLPFCSVLFLVCGGRDYSKSSAFSLLTFLCRST